MHCDTTSLSYLLGVHLSFWVRIMCFSLSLKLFQVDSFMLVHVKHKRTFYRFLL